MLFLQAEVLVGMPVHQSHPRVVQVNRVKCRVPQSHFEYC